MQCLKASIACAWLLIGIVTLPSSAQPPAADQPQHARVNETRQEPPDQGQIWREYDLRPYLNRVRGMENPERPVIDWVLRETGTDRWFGTQPGMLALESERLRVYHVPEVQDVVAKIVDRFVNPALTREAVTVRLITVESINWRAVVLPMMQPVSVGTPGLDAWLLSRENAAMLLAQLRSRVDIREHTASHLQIVHGQSHTIERWQPRAYRKAVALTPGPFSGQQLEMGKLQEGYSLKISPLAEVNGEFMEVFVQCHIDKIENLSSLWIDVPNGPRAEVQVPQVASCRIQERFRWPVDQVLLVSRGVVGMPGLKPEAGGWQRFIPTGAERADTLLFLESRQTQAPRTELEAEPQQAARLNYHNRY